MWMDHAAFREEEGMERRMKKTAKAVFAALALACWSAAPLFASVGVTSYEITPDPKAVMVVFADGPFSRGFSWQTDTSVAESEVRLVEGAATPGDLESAALVFTGSCVRVEKPAAHSHKVVVKGLKPGAAYSYRLGGAGRWVYGRTDVKRPSGKVTIVNLNDAQLSNPDKLWYWDHSLAASVREAGGAAAVDFIINGGDFIDGWMRTSNKGPRVYAGRSVEWGIAAEPVSMFYPGVPWVSSSGNHDFKEYENRMAVEYPKGLFPGCESLDYGRVHVATMPFAAGGWHERYEKIMNWLEADLDANLAKGRSDWRIVCLHWGPNSTGDHAMLVPSTTNFVVRLGEICAAKKVDLVLQAHDHTFSKTLPYRWGSAGWTTRPGDSSVVNFAPETREDGGEAWHVDPDGTYYLSCGCAGHRVGENAAFAASSGEKSFKNRAYRIEIGSISVDSKWGRRGDDASSDFPRSMFGVIRVDGCRLSYDFYIVDLDGSSALYDTLRILKTSAARAD